MLYPIQTIQKIEMTDLADTTIVERLYDLGLFEGLQVQILRQIFFGTITILQFEQTILALNKSEMSCLKF
jgi:Fe2+ transport system protein FeoA